MDIKNLGTIDQFRQHTRLQLRFNDVDVLGHVNNTVYFSFYDTGKAHYFNAVRGERQDWSKVDTVIANVDCAYVNAITFADEVEVYTRCVHMGAKSFTLRQLIMERNTGQLKSACDTVMVCIDPDTHKSREIPSEMREKILEFESGNL